MDRNPFTVFHEIERVDAVCFELTDRCPLACGHCSVSAGAAKSQIIPLQFFRRAVDLVRGKGCNDIILAGGEPFSFSDFDLYAMHAHQSGAVVSVLTSGITFRDGAAESVAVDAYKYYREIGVSRAVFSIYADNSAVHERITQTPDSWRLTLKSMDNARAAALECEINFIPMKPNWRHLEGVLNLATGHDATRVNCLRYVPQGRGLGNQIFLQLDKQEEQAFADSVTELLKTDLGTGLRIGRSFEKLIPWAMDQRTLSKRSLHVTTLGDVLPSADRGTELVASYYS